MRRIPAAVGLRLGARCFVHLLQSRAALSRGTRSIVRASGVKPGARTRTVQAAGRGRSRNGAHRRAAVLFSQMGGRFA